jgi:hypothetical protein
MDECACVLADTWGAPGPWGCDAKVDVADNYAPATLRGAHDPPAQPEEHHECASRDDGQREVVVEAAEVWIGVWVSMRGMRMGK